MMKRISGDKNGTTVVFSKTNAEYCQIGTNGLQPGQYVACVYDDQWYIGAITKRSEEHEDVYIKFMRRNHQTLFWPQDLKNECWIPFQDIICLISAPQLYGQSGRQYKLLASDYCKILASQRI